MKVKRRSATAMLAMKRIVALVDEDRFNTTNKPKELPKRATRKMTTYAAVMPIMKFVEMPRDRGVATPCVVLLPNKKNRINNYNLVSKTEAPLITDDFQ